MGTRTMTGISGAGLHGITLKASGLTGKADVGGGLSTNHSLVTSPICINLPYHNYRYFLPLYSSKAFKVFSVSLTYSWEELSQRCRYGLWRRA
jgi:hypothetical protein